MTARVNVLAASERRFATGTVNGTTQPKEPQKNPKVYMMGVGFGRGKGPHQERNPPVNLRQMNDGTMRRGYELTCRGITLGLSAASVCDGYVYQKLTPRVPSTQMSAFTPGLKDFDTARGQVVIDGRPEPDAAVLLATGLTNMMIGRREPIEGKTVLPVADGTPITVLLPGGRLRCSFTVGDRANPTTPLRVSLIKRDDAPTLNTGSRVLSKFDYLYDAEGGFLGLRPTSR